MSFSVANTRSEFRQANKVSDITFNNIWTAIVEGQLRPGQSITEEGLAKYFEVSRTPLREALLKLIGLGLVKRLANRSLIISKLSSEHIENLSQTREGLEILIATNVMERFHNKEVSLDGLIALHNRMKKLLCLDEPELLLQLGRDFHRELESLSSNVVAVTILDQILLAMEPYRRLIIGQEDRFERIVEEHDVIINCIVSGDREGLAIALNNHFSNARKIYRSFIDKE